MMLTTNQIQSFARFLADEIEGDADEADLYIDEIDATLDAFEHYANADGWREASGHEMLTMPGGVPVVHWERVQFLRGQQRAEIYVADFGTVRAILQI